MKFFILILSLAISAAGQSVTGNSIITSDNTLSLTQANPSFCVGTSCTQVLDDSTLEVEKLTDDENIKIIEANHVMAKAQQHLANLKIEIAKVHGDTQRSTYIGSSWYWSCSQALETHVEVHGSYAFKTKYTPMPCVTFTTSTSN